MNSEIELWKLNSKKIKVLKDERGHLGELDLSQIPFRAKRIYWVHVFETETRGYHAHKSLRQFVVVLNGELSMLLDDGRSSQQIELKAGENVMVEAGVWREFKATKGDATILVMASQEYDESDYIRDYQLFQEWKNEVL